MLAQRLARKLCHALRARRYEPTTEELARRARAAGGASLDVRRDARFDRKVGCSRCAQTGLPRPDRRLPAAADDDELESLVAARAPRDELERGRASAAGMRTLWDDGLAKVAAGLTSVEELARVVV